MDETQYRQTYQQVNRQRCVFEKSIQTGQSNCSQSHRFCLADREGVACNLELGHRRCVTLQDLLRRNANFALGIPKIDAALPHNKELRIQNGGLLGIRQLLEQDKEASTPITDIHQLITSTIEHFQSLDGIPYAEVVRFIVSYKVKKRRRSS